MLDLHNAIQYTYEISKQKDRWKYVLANWNLPTFEISDLGKTAAFAYFKDNRMVFNGELYLRNKPAFLRETVKHEVAHLINYQLIGEKAIDEEHGPDWVEIMIELGANPAPYHNYDVSFLRKLRKRFQYWCSDCVAGIWFTQQKHKALQQNLFDECCKSCKKPLIFTGKTEKR